MHLFTNTSTHRPRFASERRLIIQIGGEIVRDHGAEHGAKVRGALGAEASVKAPLRLLPGIAGGLQPLSTDFGQQKYLGAAIRGGCFNLEQSIALKRLNVAAKRSPVHDHFLS